MTSDNSNFVVNDVFWLRSIFDQRINNISNSQSDNFSIIKPPTLDSLDSNYSSFICNNKLSIEERLLLIMAITPHINTRFYDHIANAIKIKDRFYSEQNNIGFVKGVI
jgi:hypothetical protein